MQTLFVLLGPTGVGKTDLSLSIAGLLECPIISVDSRQLYRDLPIGTAAPTPTQLKTREHHFIGTQPITETYSAARYEAEASALIHRLFKTHNHLLVTGGSMLYIDALCHGMDNLPTIDEKTRWHFQQRLLIEGLPALAEELRQVDPQYYAQTDLNNPRRVVHALEICHVAGCPYSSLLGVRRKEHPYRIVKLGLWREREDLYLRIDHRVDQMIAGGLIDEARNVYPLRHLNALNTVGYKELFAHFDGSISLPEAIAKIKKNTRVYARKQLTWFSHDGSILWLQAERKKEMLQLVERIASGPSFSEKR